MAQAREKRLDKMERIEIIKTTRKPQFNFLESRPSGEVIFETKDLVIGYEKPLTIPINFEMRRGQKIALIGNNGIGKTTLLKSLIGLINPISGEIELGKYQKIGYFEQEVKNDRHLAIQEISDEFPDRTKTQIRRMMARCGLTDKHIDSIIDKLSGGEQAKVRLCKLMNKETNILILDEPTNHLDQEAKDALARAIIKYSGSVILVSYEKEFYEKVVDKVWNCEKWTLKVL